MSALGPWGKKHLCDRHLRKCSVSCVIRDSPIKTTVRCCHTPIRVVKPRTRRTPDTGEGVGEKKLSCIAGWRAVWSLWEAAWQFLTELNSLLTKWSNTCAHLVEMSWTFIYVHTKTHMNVCSSFIYNRQNLDTTKVSSTSRVGEETVAHPDSVILFWAKKKWAMKSQTGQEETWRQSTQWKERIHKGHMLNDSSYVTFWKRPNFEDSEKIRGCRGGGGVTGGAQRISRTAKLLCMML